jgi:hypothetical protein
MIYNRFVASSGFVNLTFDSSKAGSVNKKKNELKDFQNLSRLLRIRGMNRAQLTNNL